MSAKKLSEKIRVIQDFEKLSNELQEQIKLFYPEGFSQHLIRFTNKEGRKVSALPFETEDKYYMVRMTTSEAVDIILQDDDYDDEGLLKDHVKEEFEDKYSETEYIDDEYSDDDMDDRV